MPLLSAGILLYRGKLSERAIFLIHAGGPFWAKKDIGAWSLPKGLVAHGENDFACARREFGEETGFEVDGIPRDLGTFRQPSGKRLHVWALEGDCDPARMNSNTFELEWPPRSGRMQSFPEADKGAWFTREDALLKVTKGQKPIIEKFFETIA